MPDLIVTIEQPDHGLTGDKFQPGNQFALLDTPGFQIFIYNKNVDAFLDQSVDSRRQLRSRLALCIPWTGYHPQYLNSLQIMDSIYR